MPLAIPKTLPTPELDNRTFQEIVDDAKRGISQRCPEWTDHNVSDPGVTLIELFASMVDMMYYQLNRVPEKNYLKFLEMIGVSLEPPEPARTDLKLTLSRPIDDKDGEEAFEHQLKAQQVVAATVRTQYEPSISFTSEHPLRLVRPRLAHILAVPGNADGSASENAAGLRDYAEGRKPFLVYSDTPRAGDAIYFGFDNDISLNIVQIQVECTPSAATGLNPDYPLQVWEYWNGREGRWDFLDIGPGQDTSCGFDQPIGTTRKGRPGGLIELAMPPNMMACDLAGRRGRWVRCRYDPNNPALVPAGKNPEPYLKPPSVTSLTARTVGGTVAAGNCTTVERKDLGQSDGTDGQEFAIGHAPILNLLPGETVYVGEQGLALEEMDAWEQVEDFCESGRDDRHFVLDSFNGRVRFGPKILEPNGEFRRYGAIPEKGHTIILSSYRIGGGSEGNVMPGKLLYLKSDIPYISAVTNPVPAEGGRDLESVNHAVMRGRAILKQKERAVTVDDFEYHAAKASSGVGRVRCLQPGAVHDAGEDSRRVPSGVVRVLLVPALNPKVTAPRPADLHVSERVRQEVEEYLDQRRLLTTVLEVDEPEYVFISTEISLAVAPKANKDKVVDDIRGRLERFLHPVAGGPGGWPNQRRITMADLYTQIQGVPGIAFLRNARLYVSRVRASASGRRDSDQLEPEQQITSPDGIRLAEHEWFASGEHRIRTTSIEQVGMDEPGL